MNNINPKFILKSYFASFSGLSPICWQGIILSFIESILCGVFYFLSLYFVNDLHLTLAVAGIIISCYGVGAILGGYLGGKLSDRTSPGIASILGLVMQASTYLLLIICHTKYLLMIDVFIMGVATYIFITANHVWVLNQCHGQESERLKALNLLATSANLGLGLSAIVITIMSGIGFKYIFICSSFLLLLSACYLISLENKIKKKLIEQQDESHSHPISEDKANNRKTSIIILILLCVLLTGAIVAQLNTTYSIYLQEKFPMLGMKGVGILFTLNSFLVVFFQTPIVTLFTNKNKIFMVGLGSFLIGFGMFLLSVSYLFIFAIFACIIYTMGEMIFFSIAQLVCYQNGAIKKKGQSLGLFRMTYATSRFVGPAAGGIIYTNIGGNMVWYVSGIIGVICFWVCNYFKNHS